MFRFIPRAGGVFVRSGPEHQRVRAGDPVTFECVAAAQSLVYGMPTIHWLRDDKPLRYPSKDNRLLVDPLDNTLTISNTSIADTGVYTCVAKHGDSYDSASAQLIVEGT